jgi:hypothetical protein
MTKAPKPTKREEGLWTSDEVEIIKELCVKFGWDTDISQETGEANIGHFYVEKYFVVQAYQTIGGDREKLVPEYVLYEEVVEYNYPTEPDFSDSVEFDTVNRNVYDVMGRLWMREKEYEIGNIIEGYSMHREFTKSEEYM